MPRALRRLVPARPPAPVPGPVGCEELRAAPADVEPRTPGSCEECAELGEPWVHLRMCLTCGHVGCCDTGKRRHADAHYRETGHPVMRSVEAGESWRWCYVHEQVG